jgi:hypothetical protein
MALQLNSAHDIRISANNVSVSCEQRVKRELSSKLVSISLVKLESEPCDMLAELWEVFQGYKNRNILQITYRSAFTIIVCSKDNEHISVGLRSQLCFREKCKSSKAKCIR